MGVNVVYAPGPGSRHEPGQPGARDPVVRRFARRPSGGTARRWSAGSRRPGWPPRSSTPRGWGTSRAIPITAWRSARRGTRRARRPRVRAVPCRVRGRGPARDVGARGAAGRHRPRRPAGDAVAGRHDRPAAARPRLRGRDDLRRARHAGPRPGPGPGARRRSPRSAPASTCCSPRPTPRRWPASRRRSSAPSSRELLDPAELAATERRVAALRAWLGSAGPAPDLSVVGSAEHLALAAELAARSITLVRDPRRAACR